MKSPSAADASDSMLNIQILKVGPLVTEVWQWSHAQEFTGALPGSPEAWSLISVVGERLSGHDERQGHEGKGARGV